MEPNPSSKKRKQRSSSSNSNAFKGIFTRSKSRIYLHHSRSGRSRSDIIRRPNHTLLFDAPPRRKSQPSDQQEPLLHLDNDISHISIKDLRARRIFSPTSVIGDDDCCSEVGISKLDYQCQILNHVNPNCCDKDDVIEKSNVENVTNHCTEMIVDFEKDIGLCDGNSNENGGAVSLTEECFQMTPPEVDEIGGNGGKNSAIANASVSKNNVDTSNFSVSRSKLVKVFKTPSSFSYRRLLPFLMDISKDDSCIQKIEIVDVGFPCKAQKLNHTKANLSSSTVDYQCASKEDGNGAHSDDRKPLENGGTEAHSKDGINPSSSPAEGTIELHNVDQRRNGFGENTLEMMEECYQMTPPDADIFCKPDVGDSTQNKEDNVLQNEDDVLDKPLNESVSRNGGSDIGNYHPHCDQSKGFISKSKMVLTPCSRMKVFKVPSSVSYRRLLPYLMDVVKNNSCSSIISEGPKHMKDMDQNPQPVISPSFHLGAHFAKSEADINSEEQHYTIDEEPKFPTPALTPTDDSTNEPNLSLPVSILTSTDGSCNSKDPNSASCKNITQLQMPLGLQVEKTSELEHVASESPRELQPETNHDVLSYAASYKEASSGSNVNLENFPRERAFYVTPSISVDSKKDPVKRMDYENEGEPVTVSLDHNSSQTEALDPSGIHVGGIRKGILRRNPRGCRGLCKCLNCASFRLHAERAFEFSRNQMQDAEEVASELINELAYLRDILNETAVYPRVVQVNQVKEACSKALKTEELAKIRLGQMNEDLSFHCRNACLQQPRVTFANNVEQKLIPKAGLTWK